MSIPKNLVSLTFLPLAGGPISGVAQDVNPGAIPQAQKVYSPYVARTATNQDFAEGVYWGDTHVHSSYSTDAGMVGANLTPEDAFRFAMGEEVISNTGQRVRLIPSAMTMVCPWVAICLPGLKAPVFMLGALKDPWSGNLDRLQVVKGWVDETGERHERVYDVAVSDGREIDQNGRATESVGNTVDEANASYLNNIGDAELRAVWTDPDFNPDHSAVYYARVLEIPTPTWLAFDARYYGVEMPEGSALSGQERAYTSPIWYNP